MPTVHLFIKGKVQGVFYRISAKKAADEMTVSGWVRNTKEGDVEIMADGLEGDVDRFIEWCRNGPPRARVDGVSIRQVHDLEFTDFKILDDA